MHGVGHALLKQQLPTWGELRARRWHCQGATRPQRHLKPTSERRQLGRTCPTALQRDFKRGPGAFLALQPSAGAGSRSNDAELLPDTQQLRPRHSGHLQASAAVTSQPPQPGGRTSQHREESPVSVPLAPCAAARCEVWGTPLPPTFPPHSCLVFTFSAPGGRWFHKQHLSPRHPSAPQEDRKPPKA